MPDGLIERILNKAGLPDLLEALVERLSLPDLQSLLLEVYRQRAQKLTPADVLRQYERSRFVSPAPISPLDILRFDQVACGLLPPGFEVLELSPLAPLGCVAAVGTVSQNNVVTTVRNVEVCSDSTNVLALECARRRRWPDQQAAETRLCASQRLVRAQVFSGPVTFAHFRIFSLVTAGRDSGSYRFEVAALVEQIDFYVRLLIAGPAHGFLPGRVEVKLAAFDPAMLETLDSGVRAPLSSRYPAVAFAFDADRQGEHGYYVSAGFHIFLTTPAGERYFLIDGGFTDWTQQLLSNRKERLLISGLGSERYLFLSRQSAKPST